ncbi:tyrosine-type recombinase/integrase [Acidithiobacillus sulfurivorans]|uniref:Tyrosine-type recombinase/integrase n=1 Tax=Acidithiobacillus sulfurivorans TaxID=1958756 RepID=A0ABS5ZUB8_9PROT|nr:tyrosine-type recombinase/integrase [Acidithiobacillus sulfurivorans]MBU2758801.1 tyrosine-type recombinase/integrase [Acidithiobacillus sulfurivorans]
MATIVSRKQKDGTLRHTATIRLKRNGEVFHCESRTFHKKAVAKAWALEREQALRENPAAATRPSTALPIGKMIDRYIEEKQTVEPLGRTKLQHLLLLRRLPIAECLASELDAPRLISHIRSRRVSGTGPSTVLNDLIWLRVVYRYARAAWGIPLSMEAIGDATELCRAERLVARSRKRKRRLKREEIEKICERFLSLGHRKSSPPMYLIFWFAIYSCRRQSEIMSMRLSDYDQDRGIWLVRNIKNPGGSQGNDQWMHITDALQPVIKAAIEDADLVARRKMMQDDRLFPFDPKTIGTYWTRHMQILGIEDLHFHDLRHEGCSRLAEDGLSIPDIQHVSLHESWSSLQIYVNRDIRSQSVTRAEFDRTLFSNPT